MNSKRTILLWLYEMFESTSNQKASFVLHYKYFLAGEQTLESSQAFINRWHFITCVLFFYTFMLTLLLASPFCAEFCSVKYCEQGKQLFRWLGTLKSCRGLEVFGALPPCEAVSSEETLQLCDYLKVNQNSILLSIGEVCQNSLCSFL